MARRGKFNLFKGGLVRISHFYTTLENIDEYFDWIYFLLPKVEEKNIYDKGKLILRLNKRRVKISLTRFEKAFGNNIQNPLVIKQTPT